MTTPTDIAARIDALNPDTFDWNDAAAFAALGVGEPDQDDERVEQKEGDTAQPAAAPAPAPAAAAPAAAPAPAESSAAPAAAPAQAIEDSRVDGVATADGKRIIPYAVLQQSRAQAQALREEAEAARQETENLRQQLEAAKRKDGGGGNDDLATRAAKAPETLSAEDLAELEQDYPSLSKALKALAATQAQVQALAGSMTAAPAPAAAAPAPARAPAPAAPTNADEEFDSAIAASPLISKWMSASGPEWGRAVAIDKILAADPTTANLPLAERFAKVERMVAAEFGIPLPSAAPTPAPAAAPAASPAIPQAKPAAMPSLTDLGGTPPQSGEDAFNSKTAADLLAATQNMSEDQLMRMAGVIF